jgi:hypothetical protein
VKAVQLHMPVRSLCHPDTAHSSVAQQSRYLAALELSEHRHLCSFLERWCVIYVFIYRILLNTEIICCTSIDHVAEIVGGPKRSVSLKLGTWHNIVFHCVLNFL